jgi:CubicO group peptidase (beta-lactamase class C family)
LVTLLGLPLFVACAGAQPLCRSRVALPGVFPPTARGRVAAEIIDSFDSGDPSAFLATSRAHQSTAAPDQSARVVRENYRAMAQTLGCVEVRAVRTSASQMVLETMTAKEDAFEITIGFDDADKVMWLRGAPSVPGGGLRPTDDGQVAEIFARYVDGLAAAGRFSGVVLLAAGDRAFFSHAWGTADRANGVANTIDTRFNIASIGKMMTAIAVAQLEGARKLEVQAPVGRFLPGLPAAMRAITVEQLLSHTSGLPAVADFSRDWARMRTPTDFVNRYAGERLSFSPGAAWQYSNLGYAVLARIIEVVTGRSFNDVIADQVLRPAGMTASGAFPLDVPLERRAVPYTQRGGSLSDATRTLPVVANGFGCELATAQDLFLFIRAFAVGKLLPLEAVERLTSIPAGTPPPGDRTGEGYGLGVMVATIEGTRIIGHGGGADGVSAYLYTAPKRGYTVVVLANQDPPAAPRIGQRAMRLLLQR